MSEGKFNPCGQVYEFAGVDSVCGYRKQLCPHCKRIAELEEDAERLKLIKDAAIYVAENTYDPDDMWAGVNELREALRHAVEATDEQA